MKDLKLTLSNKLRNTKIAAPNASIELLALLVIFSRPEQSRADEQK